MGFFYIRSRVRGSQCSFVITGIDIIKPGGSVLDMAIQADHVEEIADQTRTISRVKSDEGPGKEDEHDDVAAEKQSHIVHPEPWAFEKWIPGGYNQSRMLRFKNPSTMYKVINLFAGKLALDKTRVTG